MANTETRDYREALHLLLAFRRKKSNRDGRVMCFREIIRDEPVDLERLKVRLRTVSGVWRIHRTVNPRNVEKAAKALQHRLLDNPLDAQSLETVWKTCLLQKESRGGRRMLLDIDDPEQLERTIEAVGLAVIAQDPVPTPSGGFHLICEQFDTRLIENIPDVSIQRDGYLFLEQITV